LFDLGIRVETSFLGEEIMNAQAVTSRQAEGAMDPRVKLYTLLEAAALLRRKPNWLYTNTKNNSIPHRRFGKFIVFTESDIHAIIAMTQRGPSEPVSLEG
jgi:hypothetical protein